MLNNILLFLNNPSIFLYERFSDDDAIYNKKFVCLFAEYLANNFF